MTKEQAGKIWPVMKAFAEGKSVQYKYRKTGKWHDSISPSFDELIEWRVKPETREIWLHRNNVEYFASPTNPGFPDEYVKFREVIDE